MRTFRNLRLAELIEHELGMMFAREFDFNGALVTITSVDVSPDLLQANIKLAIIPQERGLTVFKQIENEERRLRGTLLRKLKLRLFPRLSFTIDEPNGETSVEPS